jgi:hypothetical protein
MRLKRKIPTFIFGVSIGLVIGVAFFVFKLNDLFDRVRAAATEKITVIEQPVKVVTSAEESQKKERERFKIKLNKSTKVNYKETDSLLKDNTSINVATDELLSVKTVKVIKIGDNLSGHDTLASKLANVEEPKNLSNLYFIEFWKTPLNTKGYLFTKNKIVLYGFVEFSNVLLYQLDNAYYLKCSDEEVYKLFYSGGEFRKLERVIELDLLAKIN